MDKKPTDQQLEKATKQMHQKLKALIQNKNWIKKSNQPCEIFEMSIENRMSSKGIAIVNAPFQKIYDFLLVPENLMKLNDTLQLTKILYEKKNAYRVTYMLYTAPWPVAKREFVNIASQFKQSDSLAYMGTQICDYPYPTNESIVRGVCHIGGYKIEKINEDKTRVTYVSDVDIMGSIPGVIKNSLASKQGLIPSKIQQHLK